MSRREPPVQYVQVDGWWVPVQLPAPAPRYDVYDVMGAAVVGAFAGIVAVVAMVLS